MNRRALAIGAAAAVAVVVLWYLVFWSPRNKALDQAKKRREAAQQQESQLRTEIARLRGAQSQEPAKRARLEALRTAIPDDPNLAQFILDTNDAATRSGIDFISIAPQLPTAPTAPAGAAATGGATTTTAPGGGGGATTTTAAAGGQPPVAGGAAARPAEIRLALQIRGGYFQVLDFLNRLDDLPRLVVNDSLTVSADQTARLTVGLTSRMFTRTVPPGYASTGGGTATSPAGTPSPTPAPAPAPAPAARP
ncbi:MAG: type 4a pilus biogenesis protein PilO [Actinomycetota bacterium]|nr:type 4a pilus biogenesis protein PilO [Actinomycetota bacterium]